MRCFVSSSPLPHRHRHERHGVVAEDVDDFDGNDIAARFIVRVRCGLQFEVAALARAEALPFVLEDVGAGPAFFEVVGRQFQFTLRRFLSWQKALYAAEPGSARDLDDFFPAFVIEIHRPVV